MSEAKNNDLLLVIDMQNIYLPNEEWACPSMPAASRAIRNLIDSGKVGNVLFTQYLAPENPQGRWKVYNETYRETNEDPYLCAITDEFLPYLDRYPLEVKSTFSCFKQENILKAAKQADHVLLSGVVAECCVLSTMMEGIDLGIPLIYLTDCCSGQTPEKEELVKVIASNSDPVHLSVMTSGEYLSTLPGAAGL